ncbi:hypothetical protein [Brevibacillus massiliensis]|uniref:hypothetical protein n=1 Tax=Brevibacillus massiliensis TaxID=1118054 RepID=UPI00137582BF|nr:hypothetical protein [Brevibacillus massiliensis]
MALDWAEITSTCRVLLPMESVNCSVAEAVLLMDAYNCSNDALNSVRSVLK